MSTSQIETLYVQQFSTNITTLSQQKGARLRKTVKTGTHVGQQASAVDQVGPINANPVITRYGPMIRTDAPLNRRWVFPQDYDSMQLIDQFDKLRLLIDPTSIFSITAMYAMGRSMDDQIIKAYHGVAFTGQDAGTSTPLPAGQVISVEEGAAAASGLTVAKLRAAKELLMAAEVDIDQDVLWCAATAKQLDNLLSEAQVVSTDFNDKPVLVEGKINRFMGINFVHSERLLTGTDDLGGTSTAVPIYAQSGMYLGEWLPMKVSVSIRHDLQGEPYQVYAMGTFGGTRLEEVKVTKVWCR